MMRPICVFLFMSFSSWAFEESGSTINTELSLNKTFGFYRDFYEEADANLEEIFKADLSSNGEKISHYSALFKGVPYVANTLIGSNETPEQLVVNFGAVDCFTFLDYVEALRKSNSMADFYLKLVETRYINGEVDYLSRRHFFSDWVAEGTPNVLDITREITNDWRVIEKRLNEDENMNKFIPQLQTKVRKITYIPSEKIDNEVVENLKSGDYIGVYTDLSGLDVTHTGIYIMTKEGPVFRNASSKSKNMKVVDTPFFNYVRKIPGIVVYRAVVY